MSERRRSSRARAAATQRVVPREAASLAERVLIGAGLLMVMLLVGVQLAKGGQMVAS